MNDGRVTLELVHVWVWQFRVWTTGEVRYCNSNTTGRQVSKHKHFDGDVAGVLGVVEFTLILVGTSLSLMPFDVIEVYLAGILRTIAIVL